MNEPDAALPLLRLSGLRFTLPGQRAPLFDGLDLEVRSGETVVILGGSGTGKSTLAEILFGLRAAYRWEGAVTFDPRRAALLLQSGAVFEHLSVGDNLRVVLRRFGKPCGPDAITVALREVKLDHHPPGRRPETLSGGEQRRLALARALCADPEFLYFDEPSAGLDRDNVVTQGRLIRRVVKTGRKAAVVVTHDLLLAALVADRVVLLSNGRFEPVASWADAPDILAPEAEAERAAFLERTCAGRFAPRAIAPEVPRSIVVRAASAVNPLAVGDYALSALSALWALPAALRHLRDFLGVFWRTFWLAGLGGVPFFALIGGILGATFIMILLGASILPARITLEKVQAIPLTAITAPLTGFLFSSRSGSALASWLGGMTYSRQVDALKTLGIDPRAYLRAPVFCGLVAAFALSAVVFFAAAWVGAYLLCVLKVGIAHPLPYLQPFGNPQITDQAVLKVPVYAVVTATVTTHLALLPKPTSESVARGITRVIIVCTAVVALTELLFAALLAVGGGA
jgi:phospholipid/cholesterol/gamma-HCH transport system ATP-binding protein